MRHTAKLLALALLLALKPACGGGGGGGGGAASGPVAAPHLPTANAPGTTFPAVSPLGTLPGSIDTIASGAFPSDPNLLTAIQTSLTAGHSVKITGGGARTVTMTAGSQLVVPAFDTLGIDGGGITLDCNNVTRAILKNYQSTLTVQNLNVQNGNPPAAGADTGSGGAINSEAWDGSLSVINCTFTNCKAVQTGPDIGGGAIRALGQRLFLVSGCTFTNCSGSNGGALDSLGCQLTVINSSFSGCAATGTGGGQDAGPSGQGGIGGAIYIDGVSQNATVAQLVVSKCTFSTNTAHAYGGAIFTYTYTNVVSTCYIDATTFNGNTVSGGGQYFAGAVYAQNGTWTVANSTFSNNSATDLGGAFWTDTGNGVSFTNCTFTGNHTNTFGGAMALSAGILEIVHCTVAGNTSSKWSAGLFGGAGGTVRNSIFSNNTGTDAFNGWNTDTTLIDGGGNFQFLSTGVAANNKPIAAGVTISDPKLGALGSNGGPTQTMLLLAGSPCIDHGVAEAYPTMDQRGVAHTGALPDAGSVEPP
jgi:hypothetical protein